MGYSQYLDHGVAIRFVTRYVSGENLRIPKRNDLSVVYTWLCSKLLNRDHHTGRTTQTFGKRGLESLISLYDPILANYARLSPVRLLLILAC